MTFKPGDHVEYIGKDSPTLAKGTTGDVVTSNNLVVEVDFNGRRHQVAPEMLKVSDDDD